MGQYKQREVRMRKWNEGMEEVRKLREDGNSLNEICEMTGVPKTTAYGWIKDMPVPVVDGVDIKTRARTSVYWSQETIQKRMKAIKKVWGDKRDEAYGIGKEEAVGLLKDREIRDFVCMYIGEGTKKSRGSVAIINTDPKVISLCERVMKQYSKRKMWYRLYCAEDEKEKLLEFWSEVIGVGQENIKFQLKKKVSERRAEYGLLAVGTSDTYFRSRIQAWMDVVREDW
jgi:hypothetical protein